MSVRILPYKNPEQAFNRLIKNIEQSAERRTIRERGDEAIAKKPRPVRRAA